MKIYSDKTCINPRPLSFFLWKCHLCPLSFLKLWKADWRFPSLFQKPCCNFRHSSYIALTYLFPRLPPLTGEGTSFIGICAALEIKLNVLIESCLIRSPLPLQSHFCTFTFVLYINSHWPSSRSLNFLDVSCFVSLSSLIYQNSLLWRSTFVSIGYKLWRWWCWWWGYVLILMLPK